MKKYRLSIEVRDNELQQYRVEHYQTDAESLSQAQENIFILLDELKLQSRYVLRAIQIS